MTTAPATHHRPPSPFPKREGEAQVRLKPPQAFEALRPVALFACILAEGAFPILPREVFLGLAVVSVAIITVLRGGVDRRVLPLFIIPFIVLVVSMLRENFDAVSAASRFLNFCTAIALLSAYLPIGPSRNAEALSALERDLYGILKLMAYQALATFALGYAAPFLFRSVQLGSFEYKSAFYVLNYHMMYLDRTIRPDGFFYERGIFQLYLNLYFYLALIRKKNLLQAAIALAAVATTWSTTGLLCASAIAAYYMIQTIRSGKATLVVLVLPLVAALLFPFSLVVHSNVTAKFSGAERASFLVRQSDFSAGISLIKETPLMGLGFDDAEITERMRRYIVHIPGVPIENLMTRSISNGVIRMILAVGIPLALLHFWGLARQRLFRHRWIIFMLVTATLLSESIPFNPFLLCIMYSGLVPLAGRAAAKSRGSERGALQGRRVPRTE